MGGCVGQKRTEIMTKFTSGRTNTDTGCIIGVDFAVHCVDIPENNESAILQIWDIGEDERFRSLIPCFCQGASGALLFFDQQDSKSLLKLEEWITVIRNHTNQIPLILSGIHCGENIQINKDEIVDFVTKFKLHDCFEVDVENGCNIEESFEALTKIMIKQWPAMTTNSSNRVESLLTNQLY